MPDPTVPAVPATPPAPTAAPAAPQPAAPHAPPPEPVVTMTPATLKARLEEESAAALRRLGFKDEADAKAAIAARAAEAEAKKGAEQRAVEARAAAEAATAETRSHLEVIREHAGRQMMALTDEQQKAVKDIAGDNPALQLKSITALMPTWAKKEAADDAARAAAKAAAAANAAPQGGTAPPPNAPSGAPATGPVDHKARHAQLKKTNPVAAAAYLRANQDAIYPDPRTS